MCFIPFGYQYYNDYFISFGYYNSNNHSEQGEITTFPLDKEVQATMRALFLIIAVLATFQPIVQVASTDDTPSSSSTATTTTTTQNKIEKEQSIDDISSRNNNINTVDISNTVNRPNSDNQLNKEEEVMVVVKDTEQRTKPDPETQVQIEKNLLTLFGMSNRPKPIDRSKIVIPDAMKQLYAEIMGEELRESVNLPKPGLHTKSANTVRSFMHEESKIDDRFLHHHRFRLYFNVSGIPKNEKLKAAELTLNRNPISDEIKLRHKVLVYDIVRPGIKGKTEPVLYLVDTKSVNTNCSESISLDVMPAVDRWLNTPTENYGILIHIVSGVQNKPATHNHIRLRRNVNEKDVEWAKMQPLLMTYTDDGRYKQRSIREILSNRGRRAPNRRPHKRREGRELCQRKPLYVDFTNVGWNDWIVAPPGYDAYYCHGECQFPFADHLNTTNHAVVQTLVNSINSDLAPKACCVPTQLNPISMLYLDDQNKVVLKNYQDMAVVGCGCR